MFKIFTRYSTANVVDDSIVLEVIKTLRKGWIRFGKVQLQAY